VTSTQWLDVHEMRLWRAFVEACGGVIQQLDASLKHDASLTFDDYEVLIHLSEAGRRRLRMSDLSSCLLHSQSRVTQRVDRLACRGLVTREKCTSDRRVTYAVLTEAGLKVVEEAAPDHVDQVRRHLLELIDSAEAQVMLEVLERIELHLRMVRGDLRC
jgi:DNA-binding MarR family transcriptional regulator